MNSHFRRLFDLKNHNDDVEDLALSFTVGSNELAESKVIVKLTIVVFIITQEYSSRGKFYFKLKFILGFKFKLKIKTQIDFKGKFELKFNWSLSLVLHWRGHKGVLLLGAFPVLQRKCFTFTKNFKLIFQNLRFFRVKNPWKPNIFKTKQNQPLFKIFIKKILI